MPGSGSSPRVRGRLLPAGERRARFRLIPACAGQTSTAPDLRGSKRAHPRVCGADPTLRQMASMSTGSSPRVRGRQGFRWGDQCRAGLIPACAGQTARRRAFPGWCRAHPRVCGADKPGCKAGQSPSGSSPRVRGRRCRQLVLADRGGLIPACAGQTAKPPPHKRGLMTHPRVCGADGRDLPEGRSDRGSSPRVRGRRSSLIRLSPAWGLIPACAGQTGALVTGGAHAGAHPRVCGADCEHGGCSSGVFRLIPACAGQTVLLEHR